MDDEANNLWFQGDFALEVGSFLYGDIQTEEDVDPIEAVYDDPSPKGFVVVSQTCDIVSQIKKLPTVVVCPLVEVDQTRIGEIARGRAPRFGFIENAPEGLVADLGRLMSISKNLLATWKRTKGFDDERMALNFARGLERAYGRFAFPDVFNECIKPLEAKIRARHGKKDSPLGKALEHLQEIRVRSSGSWDSDDQKISFFLFFLGAEIE